MRIHNLARDYAVDGTGRNQNCDICKETNTASPTSSISEAADENRVRLDGAKRERRERRPADTTRAANRRAKSLGSR